MAFDYEGWLKTAQDRLESLHQQKAAIESEISLLEDGIKGFAPLLNQPTLWYGPEAGITDAVRAVLRAQPAKVFSPTAVRDELQARGVSLTQQNPMAAIHQTLARLVDKGAAKVVENERGPDHYQWAGDVRTETKRRTTVAQHIAEGRPGISLKMQSGKDKK